MSLTLSQKRTCNIKLAPTTDSRAHRFEQVTFRYHPESDVNTLENVSFEVRPGQMVALVGRSGSGKTTISKLILGLHPPEGKILLDGYDVTSRCDRYGSKLVLSIRILSIWRYHSREH